jgi:cytochrome c oxidase assembly factor 6
MGWLPAWGSTTKPEGGSSSDTISPEEYRPPGRQTRAKCWDSRDVFNQCLDRNNILDAIKDKEAADKTCGKESDLFEKNCASSWVSLACSCPRKE